MTSPRVQWSEGEAAFTQPALLKRSEMVQTLEGQEEWNADDAASVLSPLFSTFAGFAIVSLSPGHIGAPCARSSEHIIVVLDGEVSVVIDNRHEYDLATEDLAFVPAFVDYAVSNPSAETASYLCMNLMHGEWPARSFRGQAVSRLAFRQRPLPGAD